MQSLHHEGSLLAFDVLPRNGPTVVCIPGMGDLRSQYRHLAPLLHAAGHQVVTLDLRGHGDSGVGFASFRPVDVAGDVVALLDHLGVERAVVLGNSAGAAAAVWVAVSAPERVCGLGLLGPVVRDPQPVGALMRALLLAAFVPPWGGWLWGRFYRTLFGASLPPDHEAHVAAVVASLSSARRRRAVLDNGMTTKAAIAARLGEVRCPVALVMGATDPDFEDPSVEAREVAEILGCEAVVLPDVGHYPHQERPEDTFAALGAMLGGAACLASA